MCDPVTAAGIALSAGGTFLETREANKNAKRVQNARNSAYENAMIKQRQFADESGAAFNTNVNKQGQQEFDQQATNEQNDFKQAFNDIRTQPDYNIGLTDSAPKNVVVARQAASNAEAQKTNRDLEGSSKLAGYQGALFNQDMSRNEFARLFGNLQDNASRQSALIPLEIQAAGNNASKGASLFPTLLKAAGAGLGIYGAGSGVTSFGDKIVEGPFRAGTFGPGAPVMKPGLFTNLKQLPNRIVGGNLY